jgi:hypothetical protein
MVDHPIRLTPELRGAAKELCFGRRHSYLHPLLFQQSCTGTLITVMMCVQNPLDGTYASPSRCLKYQTLPRVDNEGFLIGTDYSYVNDIMEDPHMWS